MKCNYKDGKPDGSWELYDEEFNLSQSKSGKMENQKQDILTTKTVS